MINDDIYVKLQPLLSELNTGNVVPFIGAGFTYYFGYPLWNELLEELPKSNYLDIDENIRLEDLKNSNPLQIAEGIWIKYKDKNIKKIENDIYSKLKCSLDDDQNILEYVHDEANKFLQYKFNEIVCRCIDKFQKENVLERKDDNKIEILKKLNKSEYKFNKIITTNYDQILENEIFKEKQYKVLYPSCENELNYDDCQKTIYKIHGDINNEKSIILTNSQYYNFIYNMNYYKSKLYTIFASNTILMLGYGFNDINIQDVYFEFRKDYKTILKEVDKNKPKVYFILRKDDKEKYGSCYNLYKKFLEGSGFVIIDEFEDLIEFINNLADGYKRYINSLKVHEIVPFEILIKLYELVELIFKNYIYSSYKTVNEVDLNFIKLLNLNFNNSKVLCNEYYSENFNLSEYYNPKDEKIVPRSMTKLLKYVSLNASDENTKENEYKKLVLNALKFCMQFANDWNDFPEPFECFMELCIRLSNFELDYEEKIEFSKYFGAIINYCSYSHYRDYKCVKAGNLLVRYIRNIHEKLIEIYVDEKLNSIEENDRTFPYISAIGLVEIEWLKYFRNNIYSSEGSNNKMLCDKIQRLLDNNIRVYS